MDRPRLTSARLRARRERRIASASSLAPGDGDASWIEWGGAEIRLRGGGGDIVWSRALPDAVTALGRLEFATRELAALAGDDEEETSHEHA